MVACASLRSAVSGARPRAAAAFVAAAAAGGFVRGWQLAWPRRKPTAAVGRGEIRLSGPTAGLRGLLRDAARACRRRLARRRLAGEWKSFSFREKREFGRAKSCESA